MHWVFFGCLIVALLITTNREPQAAPWCLQGESTNCGFHTYQQCRESQFGLGGDCERNTQEFEVAEPFYRVETYQKAQIDRPVGNRRHAGWHTVRHQDGWLIQRHGRTGAWRAIPRDPGYRVAYRWSGGAWIPVMTDRRS